MLIILLILESHALSTSFSPLCTELMCWGFQLWGFQLRWTTCYRSRTGVVSALCALHWCAVWGGRLGWATCHRFRTATLALRAPTFCVLWGTEENWTACHDFALIQSFDLRQFIRTGFLRQFELIVKSGKTRPFLVCRQACVSQVEFTFGDRSRRPWLICSWPFAQKPA